jgi:polyisoprenoid-binding protein YceI
MVRTAISTLLVALPAWAAPVTYVLDAEKTELLAFTEPTGIFKGASHSHVIKATGVTGKIVFDADAVTSSWVTVGFPVSGLVVDEPELRKREGMTAELTQRDREDIAKAMRSPRQLDAQKFPGISFDSTKVTKTGDGKLEVTGRMAIHGVRKTITLPVTYKIDGDTFRGEGTITLGHKDFGLERYTAVMGTVQNAEPIRLRILLVGVTKSADLSMEDLQGK